MLMFYFESEEHLPSIKQLFSLNMVSHLMRLLSVRATSILAETQPMDVP